MKFLYILIFSFFFIGGIALNSPKVTNNSVEEIVAKEETPIENTLPPVPTLKKGTILPEYSAQSVLAIDEASGSILFQKNPDAELPPASTTKIITALTALDYYRDGTILTVNGISTVGQKMNLIEGEKIDIKDLLTGLLVYSANDAAEVIAQNYCSRSSIGGETDCGRQTFVDAMNSKARSLGLENTHFTNPSGLDDINHYSSARDLVKVTEYAMKNDFFRETVGKKEAIVKSTDELNVHRLTNINELLGKVPGVLGVKTGWTENANENLVTYIERDGRDVVIVVLGSSDRFGESEDLINWIFDNYSWISE